MGLLEENAAILTKAGVKVAINTDDFDDRVALLPAHRSHRRARRAVRGHGTQSLDPARGPDAASGGSLRLARQGQGCRFRGPVRGPVQRLHSGAGNLHRRRQGFRSQRPSRLDLPSRRLRSERRRQTAAAPRRRNQILARTGDPGHSPRRPRPRRSPKRLAVYAGRVHTVAKGTHHRCRHLAGRWQDHLCRAAQGFQASGEDPRRECRGGDSWPDRCPFRRRSDAEP